MQRPASVIVFGVLNIVFGVLGLLGMAFTAIAILTAMGQPDQPFANDTYRIWTYVSMVISTFCVCALLIAGIGLLRMRPWGRSLSVLYAAVTIVTTLINLAMHWFFVAQPAFERFAGDDTPEAMGMKIGAVAGLIGGAIGMAYPVLLWFFMTRPRVLGAFAVHSPTPAAQYPSPSVPYEADHVPRNEPANPNPFSAPKTAELPLWNPEAGDPSSITETFIPSKNGPALASYYLGLFSLFPCLGFPLGVAAVYFGIQGIRRVRKNPEVRGGVHAWVGTICGALFGLFNFALIALMIVGFAVNASR